MAKGPEGKDESATAKQETASWSVSEFIHAMRGGAYNYKLSVY